MNSWGTGTLFFLFHSTLQLTCQRCYRGRLISIHNFSLNYQIQCLVRQINQGQVWSGSQVTGRVRGAPALCGEHLLTPAHVQPAADLSVLLLYNPLKNWGQVDTWVRQQGGCLGIGNSRAFRIRMFRCEFCSVSDCL